MDAPLPFLDPVPDVLGDGWVQQALPLPADEYSSAPVATLVHRSGEQVRRRAVLFVHGYVDYFFHPHFAATFEDAGFDFYAIDLRDYGRSIRPGREPNWTTDLTVYDAEITHSLAFLHANYDRVLLAGHSTGGLIAALYTDTYPGMVHGLVLNSPWLDLNENWFLRTIGVPVLRVLGPFLPRLPVADLGEVYGRSLHHSTGGEWDYRLDWKPLNGFGIRAGWLAAILRGHKQIRRGLSISVPTLLATSDARGDRNAPTPTELDTTDVVLSPPQMWRLASRLGTDVTVLRIHGGRHDLTLSTAPVRKEFADQLTWWLTARFGAE